jgi:hypothetical protein
MSLENSNLPQDPNGGRYVPSSLEEFRDKMQRLVPKSSWPLIDRIYYTFTHIKCQRVTLDVDLKMLVLDAICCSHKSAGKVQKINADYAERRIRIAIREEMAPWIKLSKADRLHIGWGPVLAIALLAAVIGASVDRLFLPKPNRYRYTQEKDNVFTMAEIPDKVLPISITPAPAFNKVTPPQATEQESGDFLEPPEFSPTRKGR